MKKILALILALIMLSSVTLALAETEPLPGYYKPPVVNEGQYPSKSENVTLTFWCPINSGAAAFISSYNENPAWQRQMEITGINVEFIHPATGTEKDSFQLLMLADELPDMIQIPSESYYTGGLRAMLDDGVIVDLTPYMEEYAPQYNEIIHYSDLHYRTWTTDDKVLCFNKLGINKAGPYHRFNINQDWLKEFGLEEPALISEYEAYFQAVLDNKPGVIPLFMRPDSAGDMLLLMGAFDMLMGYYMDPDGCTLHYYANEPAYKEVLELLHSWYEKGYLTKDFATLDFSEVQNLFDNMQLACYPDSVDVAYAHSTKHQNFTVTNCRYMRQTEDQVLGNYISQLPGGYSYFAVVTKDCEHVQEAVEFLNYAYTYEGALLNNYGVEGEAWNWGDDGFPKYTELMTNNPQGMTMSNVSYALKNHFGPHYVYPDPIAGVAITSDEGGWYARMKWATEPNLDDHLQVPNNTLTPEEAEERTDIMTDVNTYVEEMKLRFITGAEPLENFDQYVETVNSMGLPRAIEITQTALLRNWPELAK